MKKEQADSVPQLQYNKLTCICSDLQVSLPLQVACEVYPVKDNQ